MTTQQTEALRMAETLEGDYCPDWFYEQGVDEVAAELRRLHAENVRLAALVEAQQPAPKAPQQAAPSTDQVEEILRERDDAEDFIDALLDEVLGHERPEWSSAYGRADALNDVRERMTALHKPAVDKAWDQFQSAMEAPQQPAPSAAAAAQQAGEVPLPLLVRDIAADLGTTPVQVCVALAALGFGGHSVNMAVTPRMAQSLRTNFAPTTPQADSKPGDKDLVAVPRDLIGAACSAIDKKRDVAKTLAELRRYTVGDLSPIGTSTNQARAAINPIAHGGKISRHSDMSVLVTFPSCRLASEFESAVQASAARAPADSVQEDAASAGFFLQLPQRPKPEAPAGTVGLDWDAYSGAQMLAYGRDCSNAAIVAARAPADSVTAPAGGVDDAVDAIAMARYKVVPAHESMFHRFAVVAGDGKRQLYLGREVECESMARKFAGAFLDGAFHQSNIAPTPPAQAADSVQEDAARLERERICAVIKAEDDHCVEQGGYMLDSEDCIKIVRGEWVRPDFSVDAARKQGGA